MNEELLTGTRKVTTTIPFKWWMLANVKGVAWNEALILGLKIMTHVTEEEEELRKQVGELEGELAVKKALLEDKMKKKEEEENVVEGTPLPEHYEFGG